MGLRRSLANLSETGSNFADEELKEVWKKPSSPSWPIFNGKGFVKNREVPVFT